MPASTATTAITIAEAVITMRRSTFEAYEAAARSEAAIRGASQDPCECIQERRSRPHFKRDSGARCYRRAVVIFTQFVADDLGCAASLVGAESAETAALVDPAFAIEQYLGE